MLKQSNFVMANTMTRSMLHKGRATREERFDSMLFDLGYSSHQLNADRGMSYLKPEEFLDMRFDNSESPLNPATASDVLNTASEFELNDLLK